LFLQTQQFSYAEEPNKNVPSTIIPTVGQVGKISKIKTILKGIKGLSKTKSDDLVEKLVTKGEDVGIVKKGNLLEELTLSISKNYSKWGLSKVEEADEIVSILMKNIEKADAEHILKSLDDLVQNGTEFKNIKQTITETGKYKQFGDGSKWTLKYLTDNKNLYKEKILEFELPENIDELGMRYFDVIDKTSPNNWIYYEFKSVSKVPPSNFAKQFMKDLTKADNLDQIKWIFDGKKKPTGTGGKGFEDAMKNEIKLLFETKDLTIKKQLKGISEKMTGFDDIEVLKNDIINDFN
jgi:hypothetical protein